MVKLKNPVSGVAEGVWDVDTADGVDFLREFAGIAALGFEYNQQNYNDPRCGYASLQAFNQLIFTLLKAAK